MMSGRAESDRISPDVVPPDHSPPPSETPTAPAHARVVLISLILVAAVANLNLALANVALPDIGKAFDAGQTSLNLVAVGYSLGLAASVLIGCLLGFLVMLLLWKEDISYWKVGLGYALIGIGVGFAGTPASHSLTGSVPVRRAGMAGGYDAGARKGAPYRGICTHAG